MVLKWQQAGMTLLELILVLVIGSTIFMLSIKQYLIYRADSDVKEVKYNVDMLFQAASNYYQAFCGCIVTRNTSADCNNFNTFPPQSFSVPGPYPLQSYYPVKLNLEGPLIASTGYEIKFIALNGPDRKIATKVNNVTTWVPSGNIIIWKIQVLGTLKNPASANAYKSIFGANGIDASNRIVWERLPSFAVSNSSSSSWIMNQRMRQFNRMYSTDPESYLLGTYPTDMERYYRCGS